MHIVHCITRFDRAGTEENTALCCNCQVARGQRVTLVHGGSFTPSAYSMLDPRVARVMIKPMTREIAPLKDVRALLALVRSFRSLKPDLVHSHQSKAGILARIAARIAGVPRIVHGVHILPFMNVSRLEHWLYRTIERAIAPITHAFIHVTPALKSNSLAAGIGEAEKHFVVPSGIPLDAVLNASLPADNAYLRRPVSPGAPAPLLVLLVSALEPRKRPLPFLEIFPRVVDAVPDVRLLIAGEGPERAGLEAAVARLGLIDHCELLGSRDDVPALIVASDICVLCSEREGLSRALIQYAVGGRPIVAPALPDIERVVRNGENGFLTPIDDLAPMADALITLLRDAPLRAKMAAASKAIDLSDWAEGLMCERIERVYAFVERRMEKAA